MRQTQRLPDDCLVGACVRCHSSHHSTTSRPGKLLDPTVGLCSEDIRLLHEWGTTFDRMTEQSDRVKDAIPPCVLLDTRQKLVRQKPYSVKEALG